MPIQPEQPIVVPAVSEKIYTQQWIHSLAVHAPTLTTGELRVQMLPYDPITQEIGPDQFNQQIYTKQLWEAVAAVPEVAIAFQAVIDCVAPLRTWIEAQAALPPAE